MRRSWVCAGIVFHIDPGCSSVTPIMIWQERMPFWWMYWFSVRRLLVSWSPSSSALPSPLQHQLGRIGGVRRCAEQVELRVRAVLIRRIVGEDHVPGATADVEAGTVGQGVGLAVGGDRAGAADVHDSQFAVGQEVLRAQLVEGGQRQRLAGRGRAAEHDPVVMGVAGGDLAWDEEVLDEVLRAQVVGVEGGELLRVGRVTLIHDVSGLLGVGSVGDAADQRTSQPPSTGMIAPLR